MEATYHLQMPGYIAVRSVKFFKW